MEMMYEIAFLNLTDPHFKMVFEACCISIIFIVPVIFFMFMGWVLG